MRYAKKGNQNEEKIENFEKKSDYCPERAFFQRAIVCKAFRGVRLSVSVERISEIIISSSLKRPAETLLSFLGSKNIEKYNFPF